MLAQTYKPDLDPAGWLVSEKFDGWRSMWNGEAFVSRDGNTLPAPASWIQAMPAAVPLDGELWLGRGRFNETQGIIRSGDWSRLRFMVFDAPCADGRVEDRLAFLHRLRLPSFCSVVEHTACKDRSVLDALFAIVTATGGEGLMLRAPGSFYDPFRSPRLLKLKPHGVD